MPLKTLYLLFSQAGDTAHSFNGESFGFSLGLPFGFTLGESFCTGVFASLGEYINLSIILTSSRITAIYEFCSQPANNNPPQNLTSTEGFPDYAGLLPGNFRSRGQMPEIKVLEGDELLQYVKDYLNKYGSKL